MVCGSWIDNVGLGGMVGLRGGRTVAGAVAFGRLHELGSDLPSKDARHVTSRLKVSIRAIHGCFNKRGFGSNGDYKVRVRPKPSKNLMMLSSAAVFRHTLRVLTRGRRISRTRRTWEGSFCGRVP